MEFLQQWLEDSGINAETAQYAASALMIIGIVLAIVAAHFIVKKIVLKVITYYIAKSPTHWDNHLLERKVFHRLTHVVPAVIVYYTSFLFPEIQSWIIKGVALYLIIVVLVVLNSFLSAVNAIYTTYEISKSRPILGYIQVVKIVVFIIGGILFIANLIGQSPLILLSGIGALSAITMLIFKDSILGLVAGVQLTSNDMVRVGDWIEMPKYGADGDIIDISLNTVKVQNWDRTITTIPTYALISDSLKNWRGMQNSGGRRIKRFIYIDTSSIEFCTPEMIEKFRKIHYLRDYISQRELEIEQYNVQHSIDRSVQVNGRAMTNIGTFRAYIQRYLENHPQIHKGLICMVRQLQPEATGLPIEIYAFVNDVRWTVYEGVQADIFDHIFAIAPDFGLRVFQNPSGYDLKSMTPQAEPRKQGSN